MSIIEVRGLKKSFGALNVLNGIDLNVEQDECISIRPVLGLRTIRVERSEGRA